MDVNENIVLRWNERAQAYTKRNDLLLKTPEQQRRWTKLLQFLMDDQIGMEVLDVGTGPGFLALQLAKLGHRTTGVDISTEMLRIATEKARTMKLDCSFVQGDAELLPFSFSSFDAVISRHLLGALSRPMHAYREWLRVLKPGGKVIVMDGDWTARNVDPFFCMQSRTGNRMMKHCHSISKQQGKIQFRMNTRRQRELHDQVAIDMEKSGLVHIQTYVFDDVFPFGQRRLVKEHYQRILVTAQKSQL